MKKWFTLILALALALSLAGAMAESTSLPAWTYSGDDPIMAAVTAHMAEMETDIEPEEGGVLIPTPIILKTEVNEEENKATVYGNFWIFCYRQNGNILDVTCGGECPGIMTLEKQDGVWAVTAMETARDGVYFSDDIIRFAGGDKQLEKDYFLAGGGVHEGFVPQYQRAAVVLYVTENGLDIEAYRERGRDPVSVTD